jgi:hypothetical protein
MLVPVRYYFSGTKISTCNLMYPADMLESNQDPRRSSSITYYLKCDILGPDLLESRRDPRRSSYSACSDAPPRAPARPLSPQSVTPPPLPPPRHTPQAAAAESRDMTPLLSRRLWIGTLVSICTFVLVNQVN